MHAASHPHGGTTPPPRRRTHNREPRPTISVRPIVSTRAATSECVMPRCRTKYAPRSPGRPMNSSVQSGALAATAPIQAARGTLGSATARPRAAPTSAWARLSTATRCGGTSRGVQTSRTFLGHDAPPLPGCLLWGPPPARRPAAPRRPPFRRRAAQRRGASHAGVEARRGAPPGRRAAAPRRATGRCAPPAGRAPPDPGPSPSWSPPTDLAVPYIRLVDSTRPGQPATEARESPVRIGREPGSTILFSGDAAKVVSTRHAEIRFEGGAWVVADLQSRNGTYLNGRRLGPGGGPTPVLKVGDTIRLGESGPELRVAAVADVPEETLTEHPALDAKRAEVRAYGVTLLAAATGKRYEARGTRIRLGRGRECEVQPVESNDTIVSRVHATLTVGTSGGLAVRDAESKNGT